MLALLGIFRGLKLQKMLRMGRRLQGFLSPRACPAILATLLRVFDATFAKFLSRHRHTRATVNHSSMSKRHQHCIT